MVRVDDAYNWIVAACGMDEKDIWRSAKLLIGEHGDDAATHAAMRVDAMIEAGDLDGQRVRKRIAQAIEELTASDPGGTVH